MNTLVLVSHTIQNPLAIIAPLGTILVLESHCMVFFRQVKQNAFTGSLVRGFDDDLIFLLDFAII